MVLPSKFLQQVDETYNKDGNAGMIAESVENSEFLFIENPQMSVIKCQSLQNEKQVSVDPMSLKESVKPCLGMPPPLPLPPAKSRFLSSSLPNSASSSPRFSSGMWKKRWKKQSQAPRPPTNPLSRQRSVALSRLSDLCESHLRRSKSCGEGRSCAPTDDLDIWLNKGNSNIGHNDSNGISFCKMEALAEVQRQDCELDRFDKKFKCGALCLFLPVFGKGKAVRGRKGESEIGNGVSRTVSLEKFECGSWTSSAIINENEEDGDSSNLYFDLPLELIRYSVNDANSPVTAAFVFDKDRKGVLKNGTSREMARKSHESSRHVRFSVSSPSPYSPSPSSFCISPRLRKARDDFNAFLEAQSA